MGTVRAPTLRDVAEIAGVSEMTASRVLRGKGEASAATKERVLKAAAEVGYVPNRIAGALSSQNVNLVAVVVPSISSFVFSQVLTGVSDVLEPAGINPVFGLTGYSLEREQQVIHDMLSWRPAGLILAGLEHTDTARTMLKASGIPVVEIMDVDGEAIDMNVGVSHHRAGYEMGSFIWSKGYRKIAFVGTELKFDFRAEKRFEGFKSALADQGAEIAVVEHYSGPSSVAEGRRLTAAILDSHPEIDCIYYSTDMMSAGGYMHCLSEGIDVPGRLALAGFNALDFIDGFPVQLTTTSSQRKRVGIAAGQMILDSIKDPEAHRGRREELPSELIAGDTV